MARRGIDPVAALSVLRSAAREQGRSLDAVAADVIAAYGSGLRHPAR